jgi:hypothetical protein
MKDNEVRKSGILRMIGWSVVGTVVWTALARLFMRWVSTEPGFSWAGTLGIGAAALITFVLTGFVGAALGRGWSGWWRLAAIPGLLIFAGPGAVLLPAAVGAAVAVRVRRGWLRVAALVVGLGGDYLLLRAGVDEAWLQPRTIVLGNVLAVACGAWLGVRFALVARPRAVTAAVDARPGPVPAVTAT